MIVDDRLQRIIQDLRAGSHFTEELGEAQTLETRMAFYHTPGISIAVINDFELDWTQGFGVAESGMKREINASTVFQAGSISKPVTALAAMKLVQRGVLGLDEDVNSYLKSWQVPARHGWQPRVTLRHLLSHTAGLTVHGFPGYQTSEPIPSLTQILNGEAPANTAKVEVNILPGLQARYSGGGTLVVQLLLEEVLGKPFPDIMQEVVLDPLGLTDSTFAQPLPKPWEARAATAHPSKGVPLRGKYHTYPEMAAAGLWTTAGDLAQIGVELLTVLHDRQPARLLEKTMIETMLSPQLEGRDSNDFIGLGFFCAGQGDGCTFSHGGWDEGFVATMRLYKNLGAGAIIMVNSNEGWELMDELMRAIGREYGWPDSQPPKKPALKLENLNAYLGRYESETGIHFEVSSRDDGLFLRHGGQMPLLMFPTTELEFSLVALNTRVRFNRTERGEIESLTLEQDAHQMVANKQVFVPKAPTV